MKSIYFDESGNTGADLLNPDQKVYVLASTDLENNKAKNLLSKYFSNPDEVHFKKLKNSNIGKAKILKFFTDNYKFIQHFCKVSIYDKAFVTCCHMINYCVEPIFYEQQIDAYDEGMIVAFTNMFYFCSKSFCGEEKINNVYECFVSFIRNKTLNTLRNFRKAIREAKSSCANEDFKHGELSILESSLSDTQKFEDLSWKSIDPSISCFIDLTQHWMKQYPNEELSICHDESKILQQHDYYINTLCNIKSAPKNVGYGSYKYIFPMRIKSLSFVDSKMNPSVQLCDLVASALSLAWRNYSTPKSDFEKKLQNIFKNFQCTTIVSPSTNVSPDSSKKKRKKDINAVDYLAEQFYKAKNKLNS